MVYKINIILKMNRNDSIRIYIGFDFVFLSLQRSVLPLRIQRETVVYSKILFFSLLMSRFQ